MKISEAEASDQISEILFRDRNKRSFHRYYRKDPHEAKTDGSANHSSQQHYTDVINIMQNLFRLKPYMNIRP